MDVLDVGAEKIDVVTFGVKKTQTDVGKEATTTAGIHSEIHPTPTE